MFHNIPGLLDYSLPLKGSKTVCVPVQECVACFMLASWNLESAVRAGAWKLCKFLHQHFDGFLKNRGTFHSVKSLFGTFIYFFRSKYLIMQITPMWWYMHFSCGRRTLSFPKCENSNGDKFSKNMPCIHTK